LLVVIAPTTNSPIRKKVAERLLKDKKEFGFSTFFKKLTDDWTRILSDELYKLPEDDEPDHEAIIQRIEKRLEQFREQAAGVPAALRAVLKQ
jgi:molecular chaperone DnaK (HSP70)